MTWFLALPAVVLPLSLVVLAAATRRVAEAAADLRREIDAGAPLRAEAAALGSDLDRVAQRRLGSPRTRGVEPRH